MSPEQLYLVAQEFCARFNLRIINYSALVAAAAASTARLEGIAIHGDEQQEAQAMAEVLEKVPALNAGNQTFAQYCARVYMATKFA